MTDELLYGKQTRLAVDNFQISSLRLPDRFIVAIAQIKHAAAISNGELGVLDADIASAIARAASRLVEGLDSRQFPIDVFQTGSATSTNMNVNEVLATIASEMLGESVHPNDHVNASQSSNDVIPSSIHLATALALREQLFPALNELQSSISGVQERYGSVVKTGRTHLMDATPITFEQELSAWKHQLQCCVSRLTGVEKNLHQLALGGTAVGTGINAPPEFSALVCERLSTLCGLDLSPCDNLFAAVASQDTAAELSGQLRVLSIALDKIGNDLRWMNSGPLSGLGEISLPELQPGSSIMPGKVNPVIPEAVVMVCAQVLGNDATVARAAQSGNFQLNTMLPLLAYNLLQSIEILSGACTALARKALNGLVVNAHHIESQLAANPILATALNPLVGYDKAAEIAKTAAQTGRPLVDIAAEMTDIPRAELERLLDPSRLT